jgi:DNA-binding NtrC family response regulator
VARHSVVWIGPAEGWLERGLDRVDTLDVTWSSGPEHATSVPDDRFDLALIEDHNEAESALHALRRRQPRPPLVVLSEDVSPARERQLIAAGADQVLVAPRARDPETLRRQLVDCLARLEQARRPRQVGPERDDPELPGVVAHSRAFRSTLRLAQSAANSSATVLLAGETGSGKEIVAGAVHALGPRATRPFVAINCAAFTDTLLESELFGHVKGAFTGADRDKPGLFEEAGRGTLFLDEIGETSGPLQAKLLRALQEREIRPVGGTRVRHVDARVVAASNRDLEFEAERGHFRMDLYYRLAVFPIRVPPLRERVPDILPLAAHFLETPGAREARPCCSPTTGPETSASSRTRCCEHWPCRTRVSCWGPRSCRSASCTRRRRTCMEATLRATRCAPALLATSAS